MCLHNYSQDSDNDLFGSANKTNITYIITTVPILASRGVNCLVDGMKDVKALSIQ